MRKFNVVLVEEARPERGCSVGKQYDIQIYDDGIRVGFCLCYGESITYTIVQSRWLIGTIKNDLGTWRRLCFVSGIWQIRIWWIRPEPSAGWKRPRSRGPGVIFLFVFFPLGVSIDVHQGRHIWSEQFRLINRTSVDTDGLTRVVIFIRLNSIYKTWKRAGLTDVQFLIEIRRRSRQKDARTVPPAEALPQIDVLGDVIRRNVLITFTSGIVL